MAFPYPGPGVSIIAIGSMVAYIPRSVDGLADGPAVLAVRMQKMPVNTLDPNDIGEAVLYPRLGAPNATPQAAGHGRSGCPAAGHYRRRTRQATRWTRPGSSAPQAKAGDPARTAGHSEPVQAQGARDGQHAGCLVGNGRPAFRDAWP